MRVYLCSSETDSLEDAFEVEQEAQGAMDKVNLRAMTVKYHWAARNGRYPKSAAEILALQYIGRHTDIDPLDRMIDRVVADFNDYMGY